MTVSGCQRQVTILEKQLEQMLKQRFSGLGTNLLEGYRTWCDSLLIFLHRTDVPADNNAGERALHPSVNHRKSWEVSAPIGGLRHVLLQPLF